MLLDVISGKAPPELIETGLGSDPAPVGARFEVAMGVRPSGLSRKGLG
jgi:hypothetical protein